MCLFIMLVYKSAFLVSLSNALDLLLIENNDLNSYP